MRKLNPIMQNKVLKKFSMWDLVAVSLIFWIFVLIMNATEYMYAPVPLNLDDPVSLDPRKIPEYALRSTVRLFIGLAISIVFSIIYALLAAKVKRLERILVSLLDILQSVPVVGYISFTVAGFIAMFPGNILGFELAVIFAVFTCQVWNITYCIYQAIVTLPKDLDDAAKTAKLNPIQRFIMVEFPYSIPSLVWNMMLSMSSAWFFVVASEAIIEGNKQYFLPGIGSYIAAAIDAQSIPSILYAIAAMVVVIIIYDQIFFRPLVDWADKYKYEKYSVLNGKKSWCYKLFRDSKFYNNIVKAPFRWLYRLMTRSYKILEPISYQEAEIDDGKKNWVDYLWLLGMISIAIFAFYKIYIFAVNNLHLNDLEDTFYLGFVSTVRIIIMMIITIIIWLPISVYIGLRPKLAKIIQPLALTFASFPANLIFPLVVYYISSHSLDPNIWLSILLMFSMQWYFVFNIVSGVTSIPSEIRVASEGLGLRKSVWYQKILLPAILPSFLVGAITAWGSAWNATIIVEFAEWGSTELIATGLGAYITEATDSGQMPKIILGVAVMVFYVELFNRLFWRPIFSYADKMENLK